MMGTFFLALFLFYVIMLPTKYAPDEMKAAYFIFILPKWLQEISFYSVIGFVLITPFYFRARLHKAATFTFETGQLSIVENNLKKVILVKSVENVYCNDLKNIFRKPKGKLQIVIKEKKGKVITFLLKNYEDEDEFMERVLATLEHAKFSFFDDNAISMHDDDGVENTA